MAGFCAVAIGLPGAIADCRAEDQLSCARCAVGRDIDDVVERSVVERRIGERRIGELVRGAELVIDRQLSELLRLAGTAT